MRTLNGKHEGSLIVENDSLRIDGMIAGDLVVRDKAVVHLHGMVCGDVFVEGGQLDLHGMVDGDVRNLGGNSGYSVLSMGAFPASARRQASTLTQ